MTVGETHTPEIVFRDAEGGLYDPTSVTISVLSPSGVVTTPSILNPSVGVYQATFTITEKGVWRFEFEGSGPSGVVVREASSICAQESIAA